MQEVRGVRPASVTPSSVVNDTAGRVQVVLDDEMLKRDPLNYHPLDNSMTTAVSPKDLLRFLEDCAHNPRVLNVGDLERAAPVAG